MGRRRVVALALAVALAAVACGGGGDDTSSDSSTSDGPLPNLAGESVSSDRFVGVEGVGPVVDLLGAVVDVRAESIVVTIDSAGGRLPLRNGATIEVEPDAFAELVDLTVTVVEVPLDEFAFDPPELTFYVLSTEVDAEPTSPLILEIPVPTSELAVGTFVDGEWEPLAVPEGPTTRLEFDHFSDQVRATVEHTANAAPRSEIEVDEARLDAYREAAESFRWCISVLGVWANSSGDDNTAAQLWTNWVYGACTRALVQKLTPPDEFVTVECVGDQVAAGDSVLDAIDTCIAEQRDEQAAKGDDAHSDAGGDGAEPVVEDPQPRVFRGPGEIGLLVCDGPIAVIDPAVEPECESEELCEGTIDVDVEFRLEPEGVATVLFSDWPSNDFRDPDDLSQGYVCVPVGRPRIYEGPWTGEGQTAEAEIHVLNTEWAFVVDIADGVAFTLTDIPAADGTRAFTVYFDIPEV